MKRVLILMSETGGGHRAAAEAIRAALHLEYGAARVQVRTVDVFRRYGPLPFRYAPELYSSWVNRDLTAQAWGLSYRLFNTRPGAKALSRWLAYMLADGIGALLDGYPADVVVCVHSLLVPPAAHALLRREQRPPFIIAVTDLAAPHATWYARAADRCFVPTAQAYETGIRAGLRPEQLHISGLPVHPRFAGPLPDRKTARALLEWHPDLPAILVVSGGDGVGPLDEIVTTLNERRLNCQLAILAGKNARLRERLSAYTWQQPTHIYPFVEHMACLMAAADILITKAGPATIGEACVAGLPMVISGAIPGQETGNIAHVVENGAGVFAPNPAAVAGVVARWLAEGDAALARRADNARQLARPRAAWHIAEEVWKFAHQPRAVAQSARRHPLINRLRLPRVSQP